MLRYIGMFALCTLSGAYATQSIGQAPPAEFSDSQKPSDIYSTYKLGNGDKISLIIYGEEGLTGEQQVGADGTISVPLIGSVRAAGRTVDELTADVRNRLNDGFIRNASVTIMVLTYRPFFILGEVNKAGEYEYKDGMTVIAAIARAEGFTYRARKNYVFIKREGVEKEVRVDVTPGLLVHPGDTIRVGERYF